MINPPVPPPPRSAHPSGPISAWQPFIWIHAPVGNLTRLGYLLAGIALESAYHATSAAFRTLVTVRG
ncbi:hypothetical protein [Nocardia sp. NBC_01377]|uniref:hypothetical protein n=1 Tax=Nocardia sp. NBC_01377 TaxID=2903595 RepID=UPI002F917916